MLLIWSLAACVQTTSSSKTDENAAQQAAYTPIVYSEVPGPTVVCIPGEIKCSNASYTQQVNPNNIADFAEVELNKAHYTVLDRADLGPMLNEFEMAANMGDAKALAKFKKGKFKAASYLIRFDVLKAEPVASNSQHVNGAQMASTFLSFIPIPGAGAAAAVGTAANVAGSVQVDKASSKWIVGIKYKMIDATTGEQKASDYVEETMTVGADTTSVMGITQSKNNYFSLDSMTQRLVQEAVANMDKYKQPQQATN
jgi:hypothetical protein